MQSTQYFCTQSRSLTLQPHDIPSRTGFGSPSRRLENQLAMQAISPVWGTFSGGHWLGEICGVSVLHQNNS